MSQTLTPIQSFEVALKNMDFTLPSHIPEQKFKQVVVTALQKTPSLLQLNRGSLFNACKECANDGLLPDGREAAFVPFKGNVKYMPMVQGITKKARNSGEIATIDSLVVYENDSYESWVDEKGSHFRHSKARKDRGNVLLTYAYAITKDGSFYFEEIDEEQMKAIQECSKGNNTPWNGPFKDEMRRKSALRRLCKYRLPSSSDIDSVMHQDDDFYELDNSKEEPQESQEETPKKSKLEEVVDDAVKDDEKTEGETPSPKDENTAPVDDSENIVDAEFKEESFLVNSITGIVQQIKQKTCKNNAIKYGIIIDGSAYGTFSKSIHGIAEISMRDSKPLEVEFETAEVENVVYKNIVQARLLDNKPESATETNDEVPI